VPAWVRLGYLPDHPGEQTNFAADDASSVAGARSGLSYARFSGELAANAPAALRLTADGADRPWVLEISSPAADVTACDLPASG
jgi:hypothetical protein